MKRLIIAEKPSLAKNVASAIGSDFTRHDGHLENGEYIVTWAFGHLFGLKDIDGYGDGKKHPWTLDNLPFFPGKFEFELKKDAKPGKKKSGAGRTGSSDGIKHQFKVISSLIKRKDVSEIVNCGDADREGEVIVRNILLEAGNTKPVKRLWLPEQTPESIRRALKEMKSDDEYTNLFKEGLARTYIDWLYGVNLTRLATLKSGTLLRVGRVIVPTVKAIYDRDMEIRNFTATKYYSCESSLPSIGKEFRLVSKKGDSKGTCGEEDGDRTEGGRFAIDRLKEAQAWCDRLNASGAYVSDIQKKEKTIPAGRLYSLSKLQGALGKKYKMTPEESMKIIQSLYERGYITYPRTNTEYLASAEKDKINGILSKLKDKGYDVCPKDGSKSIYDDSRIESHSAISPTYVLPDVSKLSADDRKVYDMVLSRFLAVFAAESCKVLRTTVTIAAGDLEDFEIKGDIYLTKGWKHFEDVKSEDKVLPPLSIGDKVDIHFEPVLKETKPPKHYTVETLNNYMKNPFRDENIDDTDYKAIFEGLELGTEATRTGIISNAIKSGYISLKNNSYRIEPGGIFYIEALQKMNLLLSKEKTASLGKALKKVYRGELSVQEAVSIAEDEIRGCFDNLKSDGSETGLGVGVPGKVINRQNVDSNSEIIGKCPKCGADVVVKEKGYFCSNRDCRFVLWNTMRYYNNSIRITKRKAKTLIEGKHAAFKLKSKAGREYEAYLKMKINGEYVDLEHDGFIK